MGGIWGREIVIIWAVEFLEEIEAATQLVLAGDGPLCSFITGCHKVKSQIFHLSLGGEVLT